jgi:hypothetical protein
MPYLQNLLMLLDDIINTITGGYPDETVSLRLARKRNLGIWYGCVGCWLLGKIVKNHCDNAIANEAASIKARGL